jgi:hypothetical protein
MTVVSYLYGSPIFLRRHLWTIGISLAAIDFIKADLVLNSSSLKLRGRDEFIQASREANKVQLPEQMPLDPTFAISFIQSFIQSFIAANGK